MCACVALKISLLACVYIIINIITSIKKLIQKVKDIDKVGMEGSTQTRFIGIITSTIYIIVDGGFSPPSTCTVQPCLQFVWAYQNAVTTFVL